MTLEASYDVVRLSNCRKVSESPRIIIFLCPKESLVEESDIARLKRTSNVTTTLELEPLTLYFFEGIHIWKENN